MTFMHAINSCSLFMTYNFAQNKTFVIFSAIILRLKNINLFIHFHIKCVQIVKKFLDFDKKLNKKFQIQFIFSRKSINIHNNINNIHYFISLVRNFFNSKICHSIPYQ